MSQNSYFKGGPADAIAFKMPENLPFRSDQGFVYEAVISSRDQCEHSLTIKVASSEADCTAARSLLNKQYAWRGYGDTHNIPAKPTYSTFTAFIDGKLVGTLTLGVDSSYGLEVDATFRGELNTFRRVPGAKLCELTKFAFDTEIQSKAILAAFFHFIFIYGEYRYNCTNLFIEVNPRHRRFYETMLGFDRIGGLKQNGDVKAPSQLMQLKVAQIRAQLEELSFSSNTVGERSLYPFFLSSNVERQILRQMELGGLKATGSSHCVMPVMEQPQHNSLAA
jgi:hypothetical protein